MKASFILPALAAVAAALPSFHLPSRHVRSRGPTGKDLDSTALRSQIHLNNVMNHLQAWQGFAYVSPGRNRGIGTEGHNDTLAYIVSRLNARSDFYDVVLQPYNTRVQVFSQASFAVDGKSIPAAPMSNTKNGTFSNIPIVPVKANGCNGPADYPNVSGAIALVQRGECMFSVKSANAGKAGALGLVIYDNVKSDKPMQGTIGSEEPEEGPTIPTLSITQQDGLALADRFGLTKPLADFSATGRFEDVFSYNIIATSRTGDSHNILMLGAHSDSVYAGPGINDNGSGSAALLEVALQLSEYKLNNTVRFAWWTGEEWGLLGSKHYVENLNPPDQMSIRLYLNFDMLASGNGKLCTYDGDGSDFGTKGPPGSADAEKMFEDYFASEAIPLAASEFNGRSDYGPFLEVNVPCGGLDTGAEVEKTEEEAARFGGTAGLALDPNYHQAGDTVANLSTSFMLTNTRAIAHAVATYGKDWGDFPFRAPPVHTHNEPRSRRASRESKAKLGVPPCDLLD